MLPMILLEVAVMLVSIVSPKPVGWIGLGFALLALMTTVLPRFNP